MWTLRCKPYEKQEIIYKNQDNFEVDAPFLTGKLSALFADVLTYQNMRPRRLLANWILFIHKRLCVTSQRLVDCQVIELQEGRIMRKLWAEEDQNLEKKQKEQKLTCN